MSEPTLFNLRQLTNDARICSISAHEAVGQIRKYSGEPYWKHPERVANILIDHKIWDVDTIKAAWLHDTVEDTKLTLSDISMLIGPTVADYVDDLTKCDTEEETLEKLKNAPYQVANIKLADIIDNMSDLSGDPVYAKKKLAQYKVLKNIKYVNCDLSEKAKSEIYRVSL